MHALTAEPVSNREPLHLSLDRLEVAHACRAAVLAFMGDVAYGGSAIELRDWLLGPYVGAILAAERHDMPPSTARRVNRITLNDRIREAQEKLTTQLLSLRVREIGMHFTMHAALNEWVVPFRDRNGKPGYVPVDRPRMTLVERLFSLVAADYLVHPDDYTFQLFACETCDTIGFERRPQFAARCEACSRQSGIHFDAFDEGANSNVAV